MYQVSKNTSSSDHSPFKEIRFHALDRLFHNLNATEIGFVHWAMKACHLWSLRKALIFINHLGNGWGYVLIVAALLMLQGLSSWRLIVAAGLAALLSHLIYPLIKKNLARVRPCDYDPSLPLYSKVLDHYSCPSGHVMTATAVGIPLIIVLPKLIFVIVTGYLLIAWARISLGHHYPSDLIFGAMLGASISVPVSLLII
jgi:undecaprenyl-diphosphatase